LKLGYCRLSSKIDPFFALNFDPPGIVWVSRKGNTW